MEDMTNITSDNFLNFSVEFQDPYSVEPDLSAGVRHLVSVSDTPLTSVVFQVFITCSLYLLLVGLSGFIMNSTVFWLYWKNKKVGSWKRKSWDCRVHY